MESHATIGQHSYRAGTTRRGFTGTCVLGEEVLQGLRGMAWFGLGVGKLWFLARAVHLSLALEGIPCRKSRKSSCVCSCQDASEILEAFYRLDLRLGRLLI